MTMLPYIHRTNPCVRFWTKAFALFISLFICEHARPQQISVTEIQESIKLDLRLIRVAEHDRLPNKKQGYLWGRLASEYAQLGDFARAENAYSHSIQLLKDIPDARANYATLLDNLGVLYLAYNRRDDAKSYINQAFAARKEQDDPVTLGVSQLHLAEVALAEHNFKEAERLAAEANVNLSAAGEEGKKGLIGALVALVYARCSRANCGEGLRNAEQAMELARIVYPADSLPIGHALMALGFAKWKFGDSHEAEKMMLEGIHIITTQNFPGTPYARNALSEYRTFLAAMHRPLDAKRIEDQMASMTPQPCGNCTISVTTLSHAMR
jgi:tetratricopeptide (TPR) repeat protein